MDLLLLHALSGRKQLASLRGSVPDAMVGQETVALLAWYALYFQTFPERSSVDPEELKSLVRLRSGNADPSSVALTLHLIDKLKDRPDEAALNGILSQLYELDLSGRVGALVSKYQEGGEVDFAFQLKTLVDDTVKRMTVTDASLMDQPDIGAILAALEYDRGLKFTHNPVFADSVAGLLPGDSCMFAARVDAGKTSWFCRTFTDFAPQVAKMQDIFGEGRPIVLLNNESLSDRIQPRMRQAALGLTLPEIIQKHHAGQLEQAYMQALGGIPIILKDIHGASLAQVEKLVQQLNPCVLGIDMPANLRLNVGNGSKTDALEFAWQFMREMAAANKHVFFGTGQISFEGANMLYPPMSAVKDSKTGVQGALDLQINMGNLDNPAAATLRGFSTPKNKKSLPGKPSNVQVEAAFDKDRCQFNFGSPV